MGDFTITEELKRAFEEKKIEYLPIRVATPEEFYKAIENLDVVIYVVALYRLFALGNQLSEVIQPFGSIEQPQGFFPGNRHIYTPPTINFHVLVYYIILPAPLAIEYHIFFSIP